MSVWDTVTLNFKSNFTIPQVFSLAYQIFKKKLFFNTFSLIKNKIILFQMLFIQVRLSGEQKEFIHKNYKNKSITSIYQNFCLIETMQRTSRLSCFSVCRKTKMCNKMCTGQKRFLTIKILVFIHLKSKIFV